jgi:hypothetical protein
MNRPRPKWFGMMRDFPSVAAVALVMAACSPAANTALIGKWQEKGKSDITEFRADGTFTIHLGERYTGKYKPVDSEHIKLTLDGVAGKVVGESKWKAVIHSEVLELTDPDGNSSEFQRVK